MQRKNTRRQIVNDADEGMIDGIPMHKNYHRCATCHKKIAAENYFQFSDEFYCYDCSRAFNLDLDCIFCKAPCWEASHKTKIKDEINEKKILKKPLRKKTLVPKKPKESNKNLTMENADKGVGALYIIMDTIRRKRAEEKEEENKQKAEEAFHNGVNKGRELLKPL